MSKIKRAIIMAAGQGTRLRPITDTTPKPLIKVNGVPIIETIIDALHKNEVYEIYIVVGYLKEQFEYLTEKYSINLIHNPDYNSCNNISSLYAAKDYISDTFIIDGDQIIKNSEVFNTDYNMSGYSAVWTDSFTDEWLMTVNDNGIVVSCNKEGGCNGWKLYSVSRWGKEDGLKLKKYLETEFYEKKNTGIYWDELAMFIYSDSFNLGVYRINENDIVEIDTVEDLKKYSC